MGKYVGEGFDLFYLDILFLVFLILWKGIVVQYVGCIQCYYLNKIEVMVYDYIDDFFMLQRMWKKCVNGYKVVGYSVKRIGSGKIDKFF